MRAYWQGKGGQIRSDILRYERAQMPREEIVTAIDMHQDELQLDFWGSFDKLSTQAQEKMRTLPVAAADRARAGVDHGGHQRSARSPRPRCPTIRSTRCSTRWRCAPGGQINIVGTSVAVRKLSRVGLDFGPNIQERISRPGRSRRTRATRSCRSRTSRTSRASSSCRTTSSGSSAATPGV
jgi:hypothetical protein